jgi:hypothetical protein
MCCWWEEERFMAERFYRSLERKRDMLCQLAALSC